MKKLRSFIGSLVFLLMGVALVYLTLNVLLQPDSDFQETDTEEPEEEITIRMVAIGDSLTKGVGDSNQDGGYVSVVSELLEESEGIATVMTSNYGVSGNRSDQILKRVKETEQLRKEVELATDVVLTVGGNDIVQVYKQELLSVSSESFIKPKQAYATNLQNLITEIRQLNSDARIFVFGIYNPYYVYFPEINVMQEIIDSWNHTTEEVLSSEENTTFLPINELFNQNLDSFIPGEVRDNQATLEEGTENPYLFEEDLFHPNDEGYELMGELLYRALYTQ